MAWRQTAEFVSKYFAKGRMAVVDGRLQMRDWTDKEGNKRRSAEVLVDSIYFGDSPSDGGGAPQKKQASRQSGSQRAANKDQRTAYEGYDDDGDEDLPF